MRADAAPLEFLDALLLKRISEIQPPEKSQMTFEIMRIPTS